MASKNVLTLHSFWSYFRVILILEFEFLARVIFKLSNGVCLSRHSSGNTVLTLLHFAFRKTSDFI